MKNVFTNLLGVDSKSKIIENDLAIAKPLYTTRTCTSVLRTCMVL